MVITVRLCGLVKFQYSDEKIPSPGSYVPYPGGHLR